MTKKSTSWSITCKATLVITSSCTPPVPNVNSQSFRITMQNQKLYSIWRLLRTMWSMTSKPGKKADKKENNTMHYLLTSSKKRTAFYQYLKNKRILQASSLETIFVLRSRLFLCWNLKFFLCCLVLIQNWWKSLLRI